MTNPAASTVLQQLRHSHDHGSAVASHETKTRWVVALTFSMMIAELIVGYATNSLALTADGWHMATHAGALGMAAFAYWFARKQSVSSAFSFGTGKVHALAGYTSAVVLALVALLMLVESLRRLWHPETIAFSEALPVAVLGLAVNLASAKLLHTDGHHHVELDDEHGREHGHEHDHDRERDGCEREHGHEHDHERDDGEHGHDHGRDADKRDRERGCDPRRHAHRHHGHDHNLRAAYFHVLADALTSVLAIIALLGGRYFGWTFLDAAMGIVGGVVIARWSYGLSRQAAKQLLDVVPSAALVERIRSRIETDFAGTAVVDLHLWEIGPSARACIVSVAAPSPQPPDAYREVLASIASLEHVTVEVHPLPASSGAAGSSLRGR